MKEKIILVGAGGFGRVAAEHAIQNYECVFVDDGQKKGVEICGIPVIGKIDNLSELYPKYKKLVVVIGNNLLRETIYRKAEIIGFDFPNIIADSAYISPFAKIGKGCVILNNVVIQNGSTCGNGVILNPGVEIHHDSVVGDYTLIYTNSVVRTLAHVGDRVWIGSTVSISNEAKVADDEIIPDGEVRK